MSEPRCECERVRQELRMKPRNALVECCPLHPLALPEVTEGHTGIGLAFSLDGGSIELRFSKPTERMALPTAMARALGASLIQAADLMDQNAALPGERPQ